MRKLKSEKHPSFDRSWPELKGLIEIAAWKIVEKFPKRRLQKKELLGPLTLLANHLLYKHDPNKAKFGAYFVSCAMRMAFELCLSRESEFDRQLHAYKNSRGNVTVEDVTAASSLIEVVETHPRQELIDSLGDRFWKELLGPLETDQKKVINLVFRRGIKKVDIARQLGKVPSRISQIVRKALQEIKKRLREDPRFDELWRDA